MKITNKDIEKLLEDFYDRMTSESYGMQAQDIQDTAKRIMAIIQEERASAVQTYIDKYAASDYQ
jgi:hypothetical protein